MKCSCLIFNIIYSKNNWFKKHIKDQFVKKAQVENYRSRAAFKLIEIQEKFKILGTKVLDLGSAPGSWAQIVSKVNSKNSQIVAVDILQIKKLNNVNIHCYDIRDREFHQLLRQKYDFFDTILSDMSPNFTGTSFQTHQQMIELNQHTLQLSLDHGQVESNLVMKTVEGNLLNALRLLLSIFYAEVINFKPRSSRKQSMELYLICKKMIKSKTDNVHKIQLFQKHTKQQIVKLIERVQ